MVVPEMRDLKSEMEVFEERVKEDLMAIGSFSSEDLIKNSFFKENFLMKDSSQDADKKTIRKHSDKNLNKDFK